MCHLGTWSFRTRMGKPCPRARAHAAAASSKPGPGLGLGMGVGSQVQPGPVLFELDHTGLVLQATAQTPKDEFAPQTDTRSVINSVDNPLKLRQIFS